MTIEIFLSFWSHYNTQIIEGLIALIIITSLFLAYRSFFSKAAQSAGLESAPDVIQLEKTLQKLLQNQTVVKAAASPSNAEDLALNLEVNAEDPSAGARSAARAENSEEVASLRKSVNDSQKMIEALQAQLQEAQQQVIEANATASQAATSAAVSEGVGSSKDDRSQLLDKISDLEARMAEYEIISEDIADLSKYRDENERLKKEIEALKQGSISGSAPNPIISANADGFDGKLIQTPSAEQINASSLDEVLAQAVENVGPSEIDELLKSASPAAEESPSSDLIDDELMKEFAAAVEGQKNLSSVAAKAGDGEPVKPEDNNELMDEFENFVSKKG